MTIPTLRAALGAGWRAAARNAWLAPVGMVVSLARTALGLPAVAFIVWLIVNGAAARAARQGPWPAAAIAGALEVARLPGYGPVLLGLGLAGLALGGALRVAYLAGALPTIGWTLAGSAPPPPAFAAGVAWRFPRLAGTAILVLCMEAAGSGLALTVYLGAFLVTLHALAEGGSTGAAALVAAALTAAVFLPFALAAWGDAALARTALRDEPPAQALASAFRRFRRRPAAFLTSALVVALFAFMATSSLQGMANLVTGFARDREALLVLGPELMVLIVVAIVRSLAELWRLGTIAVLSCADDGYPSPHQ